MSIANFFTGKVIEEIDSSYNGHIQVVDYLGQKKILAHGLLQSGSIIKSLWSKPLKRASQLSPNPSASILMLGLGGGTVIPLVQKYWPKSFLTVLEIDPVMVQLAQKYFHTDSYHNVSIVEADAFAWIQTTQQQYDVIIVDLFCWGEVNPAILSRSFIDNLQARLNFCGLLICNLLFHDGHKQFAQQFISQADSYFEDIELVRNLSNLFVVAKK